MENVKEEMRRECEKEKDEKLSSCKMEDNLSVSTSDTASLRRKVTFTDLMLTNESTDGHGKLKDEAAKGAAPSSAIPIKSAALPSTACYVPASVLHPTQQQIRPPQRRLPPKSSLRQVNQQQHSTKPINFKGSLSSLRRRAGLKSEREIFEKVVKKKHLDLETGCDSTREKSIQVVYGSDPTLDASSRWQKLFHSTRLLQVDLSDHSSSEEVENESLMSDESSSQQDAVITAGEKCDSDTGNKEGKRQPKQENKAVYRIRSRSTESDSFLKRFLSGRFSSRVISNYFRWAFRSPFWMVGLSAYAAYMACCVIFACMIYLIGINEPECVAVQDMDFIQAGASFMDAFQLSWVTFATVGFGVTWPANTRGCLIFQALLAYESYLGVLFSAMALSIIFGKVARAHSVAAVRFSDPICIQLGSGRLSEWVKQQQQVQLKYHSEEANSIRQRMHRGLRHDEEADESETESSHAPCPVLEFRLMNELSSATGGEIIDAKVSVVAVKLASVDKEDEKYYTSQRSNATSSHNSLLSGVSKISSFSQGGKASSMFGIQASLHSGGSLVQKINRNLSRPVITVPGSESADLEAILSDEEKAIFPAAAANDNDDIHMQYNSAAEESTHRKARGDSRNFNKLWSRGKNSSFIESASRSHLNHSAEINDDRQHQQFREQEQQHGSHHRFDFTRSRNPVTVDEGSKLVPPRVYQNLSIETNSHPFFKRVWTIRHHLNADSPLLSNHARQMIAMNGGHWPEEWNHYSEVREHLQFIEIVGMYSPYVLVSESFALPHSLFGTLLSNYFKLIFPEPQMQAAAPSLQSRYMTMRM